MRQRRYRLGAILLTLALCALPAGAQQVALPYQATEPLRESQRTDVKTYINDAMRRLLSDVEVEVAEARRRLVEPFGLGGTDIFIREYSQILSAELNRAQPLSQERSPTSRLNTMIVVSNLVDPGMLRLVQTGLNDPNPAVRYWAAQAVRQVSGKRRELVMLDAQHRFELLQALRKALERENVQVSAQQMLLAIASLDLPESNQALLEELNARVAHHVEQPELGVTVEFDALRRLYQQRVAQGVDQAPEVFKRELARLAFRYLDLCVRHLQHGEMSNERRRQCVDMIRLTDQVLRMEGLGLADRAPAALNLNAPDEMKLRVEEWRVVLQGEPFNFEPAQLNLK